MPIRRPCCPQWAHLTWDDDGDLALLLANGLIWKCPPAGQQRAIDALIAGTLPGNDRVPPAIAAWVAAHREA
jgi:hypothetical protein